MGKRPCINECEPTWIKHLTLCSQVCSTGDKVAFLKGFYLQVSLRTAPTAPWCDEMQEKDSRFNNLAGCVCHVVRLYSQLLGSLHLWLPAIIKTSCVLTWVVQHILCFPCCPKIIVYMLHVFWNEGKWNVFTSMTMFAVSVSLIDKALKLNMGRTAGVKRPCLLCVS